MLNYLNVMGSDSKLPLSVWGFNAILLKTLFIANGSIVFLRIAKILEASAMVITSLHCKTTLDI
jgi:hypothetical protein